MASLDIPRRAMIRGLAVTGVAAVVGYLVVRSSEAASSDGRAAAANNYLAPAEDAGQSLAALEDIPPGGGLVLQDADVVLVRDNSDQVRAFSATCTHQGCTVSSVEGGSIVCPCHGSRFNTSTGEPTAGPAVRPLAQVPVAVQDGEIVTL